MKTICFSIDSKIFNKLKVKVVKSGMGMQDYMTRLIREDLHPSEKSSVERVTEIDRVMDKIQEKLDEIEDLLQNGLEEDFEVDESEIQDAHESQGPIMSPMM